MKIGFDLKLNFWNENWLGYSISEQIGIPTSFKKHLKMKISDIYFQDSWHLYQEFRLAYPNIYDDIDNMVFSYSSKDTYVFRPSRMGSMACKDFYHFFAQLNPKLLGEETYGAIICPHLELF